LGCIDGKAGFDRLALRLISLARKEYNLLSRKKKRISNRGNMAPKTKGRSEAPQANPEAEVDAPMEDAPTSAQPEAVEDGFIEPDEEEEEEEQRVKMVRT
jgi:hypothetical protein